MHIALDCRCVHRHMGGIGRAALELAHALALAPAGHRITVITGIDPGHAFPASGVDVTSVDAAMVDERFEQLILPSVLHELGADLYLNTTFSIPAIKTTRFQVSILHDVVFEDRPELVEPGLRSYLSKWSRFAASQADHIMTVSNHARERILAVYGVEPSRVSRIYNGIPVSAFTSPNTADMKRVRAKYGLVDPFILYLGTMGPKKGVRELVRAFNRLRMRGFKGLLVLAGGEGAEGAALRLELSRSECAERIRLLGFVDEHDKKPLIGGSACFVYPSLYEGFGLPPLEAMALGVPCVVSDQTSLPEIVGEAALVAPVLDPEGLASALLRGVDDSAFRESARLAGPARARMFSWSDAAGQVLAVCERVGTN